jgi:hypothetical protein
MYLGALVRVRGALMTARGEQPGKPSACPRKAHPERESTDAKDSRSLCAAEPVSADEQ